MGQCVLSVGTSIEDITAWYCIPRTNHHPFILYASFMWHYSYYLFYWGGNIIQRHVHCVYIVQDTSARQSLARSPYLQTREIITNKQHRLDYFSINDDCIIEHRTIKIKLFYWEHMNRMCVWAMFTTLMKNKHWPNLHWPLCLENKPGQPRSWSNLPSLPTKYSHLVVFVTEQNKCWHWHMVNMNVDTRSI